MSHGPFPVLRLHSGTIVPRCIYGTAQKVDSNLIFEALKAGYRGLDTAGQPQHYHEDVVGEAIINACAPVTEGGLGLIREDLYIQTKFTTPRGHDFSGSPPYTLSDPISVKVAKSMRASLVNLRVSWVDTLLLHGPMPTIEETIEVYKVMETFVPHTARNIGLSNISLQEIQVVYNKATVVPATVQNRFIPATAYDRELRQFCNNKGIVYQAFSVMRSNQHLLASNLVGWLANRTQLTREEVLFPLILSLDDVCVLVGTRDAAKAKGDFDTIVQFGKVPEFVSQGFSEELDAAIDQHREMTSQIAVKKKSFGIEEP